VLPFVDALASAEPLTCADIATLKRQTAPIPANRIYSNFFIAITSKGIHPLSFGSDSLIV
jgi:hypothetical protein